MARNRYQFDEAKIARFEKQGRGLGQGANYKPWLTTADVPSRGRSHRLYCPKIGRIHHLLSDNEYFAFLMHWWDDEVVDIREQFPLPRAETLRIASKCRIKHPVDPRTRAVSVMTTDLLVTRKSGLSTETVAYAIKDDSALNDPRTRDRMWDKLDIERRYWEQRGFRWLLWTSSHVKTTFARNLDWILESGEHGTMTGALAPEDAKILPLLGFRLGRSETDRVPEICLDVDRMTGRPAGTTLAAFRRLVATKWIEADLRQAALLDMPAAAFTLRAHAR